MSLQISCELADFSTFTNSEASEVIASPSALEFTNAQRPLTFVPGASGLKWSGFVASTPSEKSEFLSLIKSWHDERGVMSSVSQMVMCPSYQRIIAMGAKAIPLILSQLRHEGDEPDMWFWALRMLTNEDPVQSGARGKVVEMAKSWLEWGSRRYVY